MSPIIYIAAVLLVSCVLGDNTTDTDSCALQEGPWSAALEDWVTADRVTHTRHGRIMALPPSQGYYVSDRIDLMPPPLPPHYGPHGSHHMHHRGPYPAHHGHHGPDPESPARLQSQPIPPKGSPPSGPPSQNTQGYAPSPQNTQGYAPAPQNTQGYAPSPQNAQGYPPPPQPTQGSAPMPYDEWQATPPPPPGAGKIVNRPPNPYKDQFKPSYPPPSPPQQPIPVHGLSDRVDEARPPPPHKQVSETDLYLLGAIEKLVYRVDLMEKRLRKMEENMHYLVVGTDPKPEPCQSNFTRVGSGCYHVSTEALNWKNSNYACRKLKGHLLELDAEEKRAFTTGLLTDKNLKGFDFWTGGLNPGLLWIWAHSAAAVANTTADASDSATIVGEGRCLALIHDPTVNTYVYRGQDCGLRHRYVCEKNEDKTKLGNEIARVARMMHQKNRVPKMKWLDDDSS